jgi:hypothetical protein
MRFSHAGNLLADLVVPEHDTARHQASGTGAVFLWALRQLRGPDGQREQLGRGDRRAVLAAGSGGGGAHRVVAAGVWLPSPPAERELQARVLVEEDPGVEGRRPMILNWNGTTLNDAPIGSFHS